MAISNYVSSKSGGSVQTSVGRGGQETKLASVAFVFTEPDDIVEKLTENRTDQLTLISSYLNNFSSDTAQRFVSLGLNFLSQNICAAGTTSNISLSGGAPNSLDGISLSVNDKVLVKSQTTSSQNGVYYVSTLGTGSNGTWTRDSILDSSI